MIPEIEKKKSNNLSSKLIDITIRGGSLLQIVEY